MRIESRYLEGMMDSSSIDLEGSEVGSIAVEGSRVTVHFSRAYIIKTMSGSVERTLWWQVGDLVFEGAEVEGEIPGCPCRCTGGDIGENVYTYRNMIPIPLDSRGQSRCDLGFEGTELRLRLRGESVRLNLRDRPRYIEHLRPE